MNIVNVNLESRSYLIHIGQGSLSRMERLLPDLVETRNISPHHAVVISDENVARHFLGEVTEQLKRVFGKVDSIIVPPGEKSKAVHQLESLWEKMVAIGSDRTTTVFALGGGVIGDLAGFLAATFARGIAFVQIPTSLLAQVDSSVGGKVGINLANAKNMVGAFWQPQCVIIDPNVLMTLNEREFQSGLAEVIKYGVIMDSAFFEYLENSIDEIEVRNVDVLSQVIKRCCELKAEIVSADEKEISGRRAILNYGHTYGHAIESVFGFGQFTHGEAIAIGMTCAARLAIQMGLANPSLLDRQSALFQNLGLPIKCPSENRADLISAMKHDKKVKNGSLMLVLPTRIGRVELVKSPSETMIMESLEGE